MSNDDQFDFRWSAVEDLADGGGSVDNDAINSDLDALLDDMHGTVSRSASDSGDANVFKPKNSNYHVDRKDVFNIKNCGSSSTERYVVLCVFSGIYIAKFIMLKSFISLTAPR